MGISKNFMAAAMKFFEMPIQVQRFQEWGYPTWFMFLIGFMEVAAAALLVFLPSRLLGAALGLIVLIGAACTHVLHSQWRDMMGTGVTIAIVTPVPIMSRH